MRVAFAIPRRPRWLLLPVVMTLGAILPATSWAASRVSATEAQHIQEEALALQATPRVSTMSARAQSDYLEKYVLYAFARDAGVNQVSDLTAAERDQAQRLVGAVLSGTAHTVIVEDEAATLSAYHSYYSPPRAVVEAPSAGFVLITSPPPPPIVLVPAPAPLFYLTPAPAYVLPARHHKWGW